MRRPVPTRQRGTVLLDRDGVINRRIENGYVSSWEQWGFLPGALEGLRLLRENGFRTLVVSNQAGVGKGLVSESRLRAITARFLKEVEKHGGRIQKVYYCTHRQEEACECRKPRPGLLIKAQKEFRFHFADAFMVGDSENDLRAAREVGCRAILISNGRRARPAGFPYKAVEAFPDLLQAARFIIERTGRHKLGERTDDASI